MNLEQSIRRNRIRAARYKRAERILRRVRLRIYEYDDMGKADKAARVIATCQRILSPLWREQRAAAEDRKLQATPSAFEPGACYPRQN